MDEFGIIEKYFLGAVMPEHVSIGPGDDCAVFSVPAGYELCVSTDTLLEAVHFPKGAAPNVVAQRCIAANLSDLAAMGAEPHAMTVALTLPDVNETWLADFSSTVRQLATLHHCPIVGGNLARGDLSVTITVMGITPIDRALKRSGARIDDLVYVSGRIGGAAGAVRQLASDRPSQELLEYYEQPSPRLSLGALLRPLATSAIDISDGLVSDLGHILKASEVGAELDLGRIPLPDELTTLFGREQALLLALHGGDDYELCFTVPPVAESLIENLAKEQNIALTCIGSINDEAGVIKSEQGVALVAAGYQHFQTAVATVAGS